MKDQTITMFELDSGMFGRLVLGTLILKLPGLKFSLAKRGSVLFMKADN
jgi:hypothetical protein